MYQSSTEFCQRTHLTSFTQNPDHGRNHHYNWRRHAQLLLPTFLGLQIWVVSTFLLLLFYMLFLGYYKLNKSYIYFCFSWSLTPKNCFIKLTSKVPLGAETFGQSCFYFKIIENPSNRVLLKYSFMTDSKEVSLEKTYISDSRQWRSMSKILSNKREHNRKKASTALATA